MALLFDYVDVTDSRFVVAVLSIAFNPLFWNLVGRWEHKTRSLTHIFRSPYTACCCLGAVILLLNFLRSHCFVEAMKSQPKLEILDCTPGYYAGLAFIAIGSVFVVSSFLALGFIGTFLGAAVRSKQALDSKVFWTKKALIEITVMGDYFGILMEAKVTCFPFSVLDNPMYWGSSTVYLGWAVLYASPAGLILTAVVMLCYTIALSYEGPFTEEIYAQKESKRE